MDLLTHAAMGAALAGGIAAGTRTGEAATIPGRRRAALIGAAAGLLPDVDALIQSGGDALLVLDYHRHFTHALAFVPFGALLAALLLWPWMRGRLRFAEVFGFSLLGYLPHPLLDACTSYGTHLWLPFSTRKEAWNLIAVVDPVFTLSLLVPLVLFLRRAQTRALHWGVALATAYLGASGVQQWRVESAAVAVATARGQQPERLVVKPSMGNLLLWRTLYVHEGRAQADAFHAGRGVRHYAGESIALLDAAAASRLAGDDARRRGDIERFRIFSEGMIAADPRRPGAVGDIRYAMLPTAMAPIWGISWRNAGAATEFESRHEFTPAMRRRFLAMLAGADLPPEIAVTAR